jgi:serine protease inhibitor
MLKYLKRGIMVPVVIAGFFAGCTDEGVNPSNQVNPVEIPENIAAGTNSFAFEFFQNLQQTQPTNDNLFVSPLSLHMALGMLLNGAENETAEEIRKTLKMEGVSVGDLNKAYKTLLQGLPVADSKVNLGLANSVWHRNEFSVENDFKNILNSSFEAEVTGLPFDATSLDKINKWASDKTNGKVKKVLEEIGDDQVMFLLNALYFKGDWKHAFEAKDTKDEAFKLSNGSEKQVKMMHVKSDFKVHWGQVYNAVQLPYANGQFNMTLLVPRGENTIESVLSNLSAAEWSKLQHERLSVTGVEVGLPRFTFEYSVMLNSTLKKLGMNRAFGNGPQFGKINKSIPTKVDFVKQDAFLGIDEKGTEAAAVTTLAMAVLSAGGNKVPPKFICDRPFALIISEKTSNTILFMGKITNPDSK